MARKFIVAAAILAATAVGMGSAQAGPFSRPTDPDPKPFEWTRGSIQYYGLAGVVCEGPLGTIFAPTLQCAHYNPANSTYFNPYTEDGSSPGILGLGSILGLL